MTFTGKEHITSPDNVCVGDFKVFKCINFASIEFYNLRLVFTSDGVGVGVVSRVVRALMT